MKRDESAAQAQQVIELHRAGMSCKAIAEPLGCTEYRVWYALQSRGVAPPRSRRERLLNEIFGPRR